MFPFYLLEQITVDRIPEENKYEASSLNYQRFYEFNFYKLTILIKII